ncbi:hypothetical protein [Lysobacter humi (ex Lee et al. 2017)]
MKAFLLLVAVVTSSNAGACSRALEGKWRSDAQASMAFNRAAESLAPKTEAFLAALLGNMVVEFKEGEQHLYMPAVTVPVGKETRELRGFDMTYSYRVASCSEDRIVTLSLVPESGEESENTLNFVGPDTYWV